MNRMADTQIIFHEEQRFRQIWLWICLMLSMVLLLAIFGYGMIKQLVYGCPWGNNPMSDTALLIVGLLVLLLFVGLCWLFYVLKLITEVRNDGLHIRFFPLFKRLIPFENISSCEARTYRPIREYGGWGIRWGLGRGKAYNISGNRGVQLMLVNGKRLLIGSQRADELAKVIQVRVKSA